jgi:hypothetical protein
LTINVLSLVEQAQIGHDLAEKAKKSIGPSNSWGGVVGRIKWLMDTLAPIAGVRVIFVLSSFTNPTSRSQLHPIAQMAYSVISVIPQVPLFASLFEGNTHDMFTLIPGTRRSV